jgi:hypothetical protein
MIRSDHEETLIIKAFLLEKEDELIQLIIDVFNLSAIGIVREFFLIGRRRSIGRMRIVEMNPGKKLFIFVGLQPAPGFG